MATELLFDVKDDIWVLPAEWNISDYAFYFDFYPNQKIKNQVLSLTYYGQKLTLLPVRKLTVKMSNIHILEKEKDDSVSCATAPTVTPESSPKKNMIIVSKYHLHENGESGVFRSECGKSCLPGM